MIESCSLTPGTLREACTYRLTSVIWPSRSASEASTWGATQAPSRLRKE